MAGIRYISVLLFIGLLFWSCEEQPDTPSANAAGNQNILNCGLDTLFSKEVGGPGNTGYDLIRLDDDCSYVLAGKKTKRPWLLKVDESGNEVWSRVFDEIPQPQGDFGEGYQFATAVNQTSDGGFILCSSVYPTHPSYGTGYVIKADSAGQTEWLTELDYSRPHHGQDIIQTLEGDYLLVGWWYVNAAETNQKSAFMARIGEGGSIQWTQRYGGDCDEDQFNAVVQTDDGGFITVGEFEHEGDGFNCSFYGYMDLWFVKTDSEGNMVQEAKYGGPYWERATDIVPLPDGNYAVSGRKRHTKQHPINAWLLKMSSTGSILWEWDEPDYSSGISRGDELRTLSLTDDGQTIISMGFKYAMPIDNIEPKVWAFNANSSTLLWSNNYGGEASDNEGAGIVNAFDGGFLFFGYNDGGLANMSHHLRLTKTDSEGNTVQQ